MQRKGHWLTVLQSAVRRFSFGFVVNYDVEVAAPIGQRVVLTREGLSLEAAVVTTDQPPVCRITPLSPDRPTNHVTVWVPGEYGWRPADHFPVTVAPDGVFYTEAAVSGDEGRFWRFQVETATA